MTWKKKREYAEGRGGKMGKVMRRKDKIFKIWRVMIFLYLFVALTFLGHSSKPRALPCPHRAIISSSGTDKGHTTDNLIWDREAFHQWRERES
jgi:hypothetical protein